MRLVTLSRSESDFDSYLRGTFSKTERALPVQSLNVDTESETVTFQVVDRASLPQPSPFVLWAQVFRLRNLVAVLLPLYLIVLKNVVDEDAWEPWLALLSAVGAVSLSLGAFLLNDYLDHVKGVDRIHPLSGSRAIQRGWVTAEETKRWSWVYLVLGALLGVPSLFTFPQLFWVLIPPAAVALVSWLMPSIGLKYRRGAEWVVFFLFGPFLSVGYQIAISGDFDLESVAIGILTGWHFCFLVHLKNFEALLVNSQAGFRNTLTRFGFEKGRAFLELWWMGFLILMAAYQWVYHAPDWFLAFVILPVIFSLGFWLSLRRLTSPAGSGLARTVRLGRVAAQLTLLLWILQSLWYWLVIELGSAA